MYSVFILVLCSYYINAIFNYITASRWARTDPTIPTVAYYQYSINTLNEKVRHQPGMSAMRLDCTRRVRKVKIHNV